MTIIGVGDIMPGGILSGVNEGCVSEDVLSLLRDADIRVGTLECAIGNVPTFYEEKMKRLADVIYARDCDLQKLKIFGIDIVSLANNHFFDLGPHGVNHTIDLLEELGVAYIGAGRNIDEAQRPVVKNVNGKTIAFTAFCDWRDETVGWCPIATETQAGVNPMFEEYFVDQIKELKKTNDYVVVMPHWGKEHTWVTTNHVYYTSKKMLNAGADIILGSHPHRVQPIVKYKNGIVAYSLGNFFFPDRLICKPRSTYYDDIIKDFSKLPKTEGYPYVEKVTYKAWKPLANIGMIAMIDLDSMQALSCLTLMNEQLVCVVHKKGTELVLAYRRFLLKYAPYGIYYSLFHGVPRFAKTLLMRCLCFFIKPFRKK